MISCKIKFYQGEEIELIFWWVRATGEKEYLLIRSRFREVFCSIEFFLLIFTRLYKICSFLTRLTQCLPERIWPGHWNRSVKRRVCFHNAVHVVSNNFLVQRYWSDFKNNGSLTCQKIRLLHSLEQGHSSHRKQKNWKRIARPWLILWNM